ncbi:hypothetical protein OU997_09910 [Pseudomonas sp. SL4(2022)]|uniref:CS1 type fimbrial major subunit n=1 Tax=Pseudomonas sp. SL4(2022) TaxID=2994661 RepID=UPI00227101E4|nr:CS1 type fimbrial major subunit [Pseudomonas sp. SL4(2022)]WAC46446.1 hypothetical protein OU997_09910 [Pseudomonas sp. SL4(2022)]
MLNKLTFITAASSLALISASVFAAEDPIILPANDSVVAPQERAQFEVKLVAKVPTENFQITANNPSAVSVEQHLFYNGAQKEFYPFITSFRVKSTSAVYAKLTDATSNKLYALTPGGLETMDLSIRFNGVLVNDTKTEEVVTKTQAGLGNSFDLFIKPQGAGEAGLEYRGAVGIIFEASAV